MSASAALQHPHQSAWPSSQSNLHASPSSDPPNPLSPSSSHAAYQAYPSPLSPSPPHPSSPVNTVPENEREKDILGGEVGLRGLFVSPVVGCFTHPTRYVQPWLAVSAFGFVMIAFGTTGQKAVWYWLPMYALLLLVLSPYTRDPASFFAGSLRSSSRLSYSYVFLTASSFTAWLFAKSVANASTLGFSYGLLGGLSYAAYYTGFWTTAVVVYVLRSKGYSSFMEAIYSKYGWYACVSFTLALLYRLNNEIWSNLVVVGSFYGASQDPSWWTAVAIAASIPALYIIIGGVKSSMITDLFQGVFVLVYLIIVLAIVVPRAPHRFDSGVSWTLKGGADQLCVSLLQGVLSYPFMDPAMTDRAFLGNKRAMIAAFFTGGTMAMVFITLFSFVGIYGKQIGLASGAPATVTAHIGSAAFAACSLISVSDSIATMDNTFSALAKLVGVELYSLFKEWRPRTVFTASQYNMYIGRVAIIIFCIAGVLPLLSDPTALSATTVTGTVVMGLGPSIWLLVAQKGPGEGKRRPWAFLLPFWFGVIIGGIYQGDGSELGTRLKFWSVGDGNNKILLGTNLYGALIAWFALFPIGWFLPWPAMFDRVLPQKKEQTTGTEMYTVKTEGVDALKSAQLPKDEPTNEAIREALEEAVTAANYAKKDDAEHGEKTNHEIDYDKRSSEASGLVGKAVIVDGEKTS